MVYVVLRTQVKTLENSILTMKDTAADAIEFLQEILKSHDDTSETRVIVKDSSYEVLEVVDGLFWGSSKTLITKYMIVKYEHQSDDAIKTVKESRATVKDIREDMRKSLARK